MKEQDEVIRVALDIRSGLDDRLRAIADLGQLCSADAISALLEIGERSNESADVLRAAGSALSMLAGRGMIVGEFDMRNLQGLAYDAFCEDDS